MSLVSRNFDQLIDFTRTSAATYVDSTGKIVTTPASRNLLTYTQEFNNAIWVKDGTSATANSTNAPDGTATADTITAPAGTAPHRIYQVAGPVSVPLVFSIYAKANTLGFIQLRHASSSNIYANFDLSSGVVGTVGSSATASISAAGNGWYRCFIFYTPASSASNSVNLITSATAANSESWTATGTESVYLWGAQLEQASAATDYTRNNGGVYPPRFDYDPVTLAPKGLLIEEQRSNLVTYSEQFDNASWTKIGTTVSANAATSPDGTADADSLVEDSATSDHRVNQPNISAGSGANTFSVYLKAGSRTFARIQFAGTISAVASSAGVDVNLSTGATGSTAVVGNISAASVAVTNVGNGWYRVALTATLSASGTLAARVFIMQSIGGSTSYTGDGISGIYIWGAQLEAGTFATSYIPTVASQVTRTADQAAINAPNFASWYNQSEGTFLAEFTSGGLGAINSIVASSDGGATNEIYAYTSTTSAIQRVATGNVQQVNSTAGSVSASTTYKLAMAYKLNDFAVSLGGAAAVTDTSGTVPTVDRLTIGARGSLSSPLNGHIRSIRYYPTRLSNAQLQALTA